MINCIWHRTHTTTHVDKGPKPQPQSRPLLVFCVFLNGFSPNLVFPDKSIELITVPLSHVPKIGTSLRHTTTQLTLRSVGSMSQFNASQLHILGTCGE